mmetsp:Transcript_10741/g.34138  ORF Transcript_10741/g.34138 Transcript_10741/m.34138 type:complete len:201 (+) Transcript_10741:131-733(+)
MRHHIILVARKPLFICEAHAALPRAAHHHVGPQRVDAHGSNAFMHGHTTHQRGCCTVSEIPQLQLPILATGNDVISLHVANVDVLVGAATTFDCEQWLHELTNVPALHFITSSCSREEQQSVRAEFNRSGTARMRPRDRDHRFVRVLTHVVQANRALIRAGCKHSWTRWIVAKARNEPSLAKARFARFTRLDTANRTPRA